MGFLGCDTTSGQQLTFRAATLDDKARVLAMRENVYRGLDYLPDYYDFFIQDPHRKCIVGETADTIVCILFLLYSKFVQY